MARQFDHGFENDYLEDWTPVNASASGAQKRTGNYSVYFSRDDIGGPTVCSLTRAFTAKDEVYVQGAFYNDYMTANTAKWIGIKLDNAGSADELFVYVDALDHTTLYWSWSGSSGSVPFAWVNDAWYVMEVHAKVDPAGNEVLQVRIDGQELIDVSGEYSVAFSTFDKVQLYALASGNVGGWTKVHMFWDDFFLNDTDGASDNDWVNQKRLYPLYTTADGTYTELDRGGVDSGSNEGQIDELPPDGTEWVESATVDEKDSYDIDDTPALIDGVAYAIHSLVLRGRAKVTIGGMGAGWVPFLLSGGSIPSSCPSHWTPTTSWLPYRCRRTLDPNGDISWVRAAVDLAEIGVKVV